MSSKKKTCQHSWKVEQWTLAFCLQQKTNNFLCDSSKSQRQTSGEKSRDGYEYFWIKMTKIFFIHQNMNWNSQAFSNEGSCKKTWGGLLKKKAYPPQHRYNFIRGHKVISTKLFSSRLPADEKDTFVFIFEHGTNILRVGGFHPCSLFLSIKNRKKKEIKNIFMNLILEVYLNDEA
jgi:hypothetical protein